MSAIHDWGDYEELMSWTFSSDEPADTREVVATAFSEKTARPAWQAALGDLVAKLEDLRLAVESFVHTLLPFTQAEVAILESDAGWCSDDQADPHPVGYRVEPI